MSTTAQGVFELAIHLMDEQHRHTGAADFADTAPYKNRTLAILNVLLSECLPCSDTFAVPAAGGRPVCPEITGFDTPIPLDDGICRGVLPYGLAAHLLLDEHNGLAAYFSDRYRERLAALNHTLPRAFVPIEEVYGGIGFSGAARW